MTQDQYDNTPVPECEPAPLTLTIEPRDVYGQTKFYPACDKSRIFAKLLGQTTFTRANLTLMLKLGVQIDFIHKDIEL